MAADAADAGVHVHTVVEEHVVRQLVDPVPVQRLALREALAQLLDATEGFVVVGSDGFGFARDGGSQFKIQQVGNVVVEDDVEIGANCTLDRGTIRATRIGHRTKLDNLVHIGHNVEVGDDTLLCGQVGIAGSTRVGSRVAIGDLRDALAGERFELEMVASVELIGKPDELPILLRAYERETTFVARRIGRAVRQIMRRSLQSSQSRW